MSHPILFTKYSYEKQPPRIEIELSTDEYLSLQHDCASYPDRYTLNEIAEHDPTEAYLRLRRTLCHLISQCEDAPVHRTAYTQELEDGIVVSTSTSIYERVLPASDPITSEVSPTQPLRDHMINLLPEPGSAHCDVVILTRLSEEQATLFGRECLDILSLTLRQYSASDQL